MLVNTTGIVQNQNFAENMPLTMTQMSSSDALALVATLRNWAADISALQQRIVASYV